MATKEEFYVEAKKYGQCVLANLNEMLAKLEHARQCDGEEIDGEPCEHLNDDEWHNEDDAQRAIDDDPLSIQVRDGWKSPGAESEGPEEYEILITTGGPAARIIGQLGEHSQPTSARFEYQDWFQPWTEVIFTSEDHKTLVDYVNCFYFGD